MTKPLASGAATRWHGYIAREGFGSTRIKNQISDNRPTMGHTHISQEYFLLRPGYSPVFGHCRGVWAGCLPSRAVRETDEVDFIFLDSIFAPP
jgi:hypothetical protein